MCRVLNGRRADGRRAGPLRRSEQGALVGGVAAGVAARTGIDVGVVRTAFVVAALLSGFGVAVYVVAWLIVPASGQDRSIASRSVSDARGIALATVVASMIVVALVVASIVGAGWLNSFALPLVVGAAGLVLIRRNADTGERERLAEIARHLAGTADTWAGGAAGGAADSAAGSVSGGAAGGPAHGARRPRFGLRLLLSGTLLVAGLVVLLTVHKSGLLLRPLAGVALLVAALVVLLGPWWLRIARDLVTERQARVRAEERADIAARVHDSVLQTLALIQRRADDPQQVVGLARAQERELRSWLFDGRPPGSLAGLAATVADGVRRIQQDVEAAHGVTVEAVTVGDCALDDDLTALLEAAREATVNAAKWSGERAVSLFAEVDADEVAVFVRDRGRGFDPQAVPPDRKGIAESVRARVARRGGSAVIRSAPGEGAEVRLTMPRPASEREPSRAT